MPQWSVVPQWFVAAATSWIVVACLVVGVPTIAWGAEAEFVGVLALASDPEVAESLGLTEQQRTELQQIVDRREAEAVELALELRDASPQERTERLGPFRTMSEQLGLAILSPEQQQRLDQLRIDRLGLRALAEAAIADQLRLSEEQREKIKEQLAAFEARAAEADGAEQAALRAELERTLFALLSTPQRTGWELMIGHRVAADLTTTEDQPASPAATSPAATTSGSLTQDTASSTETPSTATPATSDAATSDAAKVPSAVAAPGPATPQAAPAPSTGIVTSSERPVTPPVASNIPLEDRRLRFNFRYAPWAEVLDWFATQADLSMVLDVPPSGTFNYTDNREYSPAEAIDLLNSVLLTKGYTLVRRDRMLMVVNLEDGVPPNLVPYVPVEKLAALGDFELVTTLFTLHTLSAEDGVQELQRLIGPQGSIVPLVKARQLQVTETAGRLRLMRSVLEAADRPPGQAPSNMQVFAIEHAYPDDVLTIIRQMLDIPREGNASSDGSVRFSLDTTTSKLLVTAPPEKLVRVEEILKTVDVPLASGGVPTVVEQPQLEVYSIVGADPTLVLQVMQTLLANMPDVRLATDPATGNLVALARPSEHATIRATLTQLQRDSKQVDVIALQYVDPALAVLSISKLFGIDSENPNPMAPKVDANLSARQLLVRGSPAQIEQIRALLVRMGESADGATTELARSSSNVRMLPLPGRQARAALDQLEVLWPTLRNNKIRVVTPSAVMPTLRPSQNSPPVPEPSAAAARPSETGGMPAAGALTPELLELLRRSTILDREQDEQPGNAAPVPSRPGTPSLRVPPGGNTVPRAAPPARPGAGATEADEAMPEVRQTSRPRVSAQYVAQVDQPVAPVPAGSTSADAAPADTVPIPSAPAKPAAQPVTQPATPPGVRVVGEAPAAATDESMPPIIVAPGPNGVMIASEDLEALDEFESLLTTLASGPLAVHSEFTIFYLRNATAAVAAETLAQIFGGATTSDGGGGTLIEDLAGAAFGGMGGGLMGNLLGLGGGGETISLAGGTVQIIPDARLNALIVRAGPQDIDSIEQLLTVIDQQDVPESVVSPRPRMIPVFNTSAAQIATILREVYQENLGGASRQRQATPEDFLAALRGGNRGGQRGGNNGGGRGAAAAAQPVKMTLGVDERTNSLIVAAPEPLFEEVRQLVETLDGAATDSNQAVRVVTLKRSNPATVQKALSAIAGPKVQSTPAASGPTAATGSGRDAQAGNQQDQDQMRQRIEMFNSLRNQGGGGGQGGGQRGGGGGGQRGGGGGPGGGQRGGGRG